MGCLWARKIPQGTRGGFKAPVESAAGVVDDSAALRAEAEEEHDVVRRLLELVEEQFHRLDGRHAGEGAAQDGDQEKAEQAMRYIYARLPEDDPRRERFRAMIEAIGEEGATAPPTE